MKLPGAIFLDSLELAKRLKTGGNGKPGSV